MNEAAAEGGKFDYLHRVSGLFSAGSSHFPFYDSPPSDRSSTLPSFLTLPHSKLHRSSGSSFTPLVCNTLLRPASLPSGISVAQPSGCCPQSCCKKISTIDPCAAGPMTGSTAVRRRNTFSFSFPLSVVIQRRRGGKPRCRKIPLKKNKKLHCKSIPVGMSTHTFGPGERSAISLSSK